jgi:hypothetical protein
MIEQFMTLIIKELGPTGLLILGLYWLVGKSIKDIASHIKTINHNSTEIKDILKTYVEGLNQK